MSRGAGLGRDFQVYYCGRVIAGLGVSFTRFAIPLLVLQLTGSAEQLGISLAVSVLPNLMFGLVIGAVVDRVDRRRLLITADATRALLLLAIPVLDAVGALQVSSLYIVLFLTSTCGVVFQTGEFAGVTQLVRHDQLARANGRIQTASAVANIVGPVLAGVGSAMFALSMLLVVNAATALVSVLTVALVRRPLNGPRDLPSSNRASPGFARRIHADVREGLLFVLRHPTLKAISVMMALINLLGAATLAQLPLLVSTRYGASNLELGSLYAAGGIGVAVFATLAAPLRRRIPVKRLMGAALVVDGLAVAAMGVTRDLDLAFALWGLSSGAAVLFNIMTTTLRQSIVPDALLGRVVTVSSVIAWSAVPLGAAAGGVVVGWWGDVGALFLFGGVATATIAVSFFAFGGLVRSPRRARRHAASEPLA